MKKVYKEFFIQVLDMCVMKCILCEQVRKRGHGIKVVPQPSYYINTSKGAYMFYYLYEIKNRVNNKIYVGVHKTKNINDGYMGSGKIIKNAIEKYGIQNFDKTIIEYFTTAKEMFAREKEIVNENFLSREDTYNLRRGGTGGFDFINNNKIVKFKGKKHSKNSKTKMGHPKNKHWLGKKHSEETKQKIGLKSKEYNTGRVHSEETKSKIRKAALNQKQEIVKCPHCEKIGNKNILFRWHFNNCKYKK